MLEQHIQIEETLLFAYINKLLELKKQKKDSISVSLKSPLDSIIKEHRKIEKLLAKLRLLSTNYSAPKNANPSLKLFYAQLFNFEQDIHKHIFLEENILFPKIIALEKRNY